jgi:hypothetical protein
VRRTTGYDPVDDHDDPQREPTPNVHRISTEPGSQRQRPRGDVRRLSTARRTPQRQGPDPRVWFIRGSIGIAALAGLWLGLQALFPITESRVSETPVPTQAVDAIAVGAPESPAGQAVAPPAQPQAAAPEPAAEAQPQAAAESQQPAPAVAPQPAPTAEGDRLPGLPTPGGAPVAAAPAPAQPAAQAKPSAAAPAPAQQADAKPTLAPIPPPPNAQASTSPADQQAAQTAAQQVQQAQAAAPKPQAPAAAPAAPSGGGAFALAASASPSNPVSEQAMVTISVKATQGGAALAGAQCMATVYYRTATIKQPNGGFRTNANGVASFTLDARGTTYGHYIPVDVTCSGRSGTVTARTGFTPVKGSR